MNDTVFGALLEKAATDPIVRMEVEAQLAALPTAVTAPILARATWRNVLARPDQLPPADQQSWSTWILLAGRGYGKTRAAVEWMWWEAWRDPGSFNHIVVRRSEDLEKVAFEGESGLFRHVPPEIVADRTRSPYRMKFTNGAILLGFSADDPDVLRGPQCHRTWCDELAAWRRLIPAWDDGVVMGTRLTSKRNGGRPKKVITTTPRPLKMLRELLRDEDTRISRGSTYDNAANLAPSFLAELEKKYKGTRRGRQELAGELLTDIPGALWQFSWIEETRLWELPKGLDMVEVVVAIDPPASSEEGSNEAGIVAAGRDRAGRGYVLQDISDIMSPEQWSESAILLHDQVKADHITVEVNQGGEMCRTVLDTTAERLYRQSKRASPYVVVKMVHASRGKEIRAEPVSQCYEQKRVSHVGEFTQLEDQLTTFTKMFDRKRSGSPDRLDALVWALTDLLVEPDPTMRLDSPDAGMSRWAAVRSGIVG